MAFKLNPRLFDELEHSPEHRKGLADAASVARDHAEQFARAAGGPWMPPTGSGTGQMIIVHEVDDEVRLTNLDYAGHLIEWGSVNNPPHAPLRRGVQAGGLRLDENPK